MPIPRYYWENVKGKELIEVLDYIIDNSITPPQDLPVASTTQLGVVALAEDVEVGNERVITSNLLAIALDDLAIEEMYKLEPVEFDVEDVPVGRTEYYIENGRVEHVGWMDWLNGIFDNDLDPGNYSFLVSTIRSSETSIVVQTIDIMYTADGTQVRPVSRVIRSFIGETFLGVRFLQVNHTGIGAPTANSIMATPGSTYTDMDTGKRYVTTGVPDDGYFTVSNWVEDVPPEVPKASMSAYGTVRLTDTLEYDSLYVPTSEAILNYVADNKLYALANIKPSFTSFPLGKTEYFIMNGNDNHIDWISWLNTLTGITNEGFNYSFKISTFKTVATGTSRTIQEIIVYLAFNASTYNKVMLVTRIFNGTTLAQTRIDAVNNMGYGTPSANNCFALPGSIYTNISTGIQYKATGTPTAGNFVTNGWTQLAPAETKTLREVAIILQKTSSGWSVSYPYGSDGISYTIVETAIAISYSPSFSTQPLIKLSNSSIGHTGTSLSVKIFNSFLGSVQLVIEKSDGSVVNTADVETNNVIHFSASTYL